MAGDRICLAPGCDRPSYVPGSGLGYCGMHYRRFRKYGDVSRGRLGRSTCSVEDCESFVCARGLCTKHYTRLRRHGSPTARMPGEVVDGKRICPRCRQDRPLDEFRGRKLCHPCANEYARQTRAPYEARPKTPKLCINCGIEFLGDGRQRSYCSRECFRADQYRANHKNVAARRAAQRTVVIERFRREEIFERDGWTCQICGHHIDPAARRPDPHAASIDHVIPISRGGVHSRANVQTACLRCNFVKGAKMPEGVAA